MRSTYHSYFSRSSLAREVTAQQIAEVAQPVATSERRRVAWIGGHGKNVSYSSIISVFCIRDVFAINTLHFARTLTDVRKIYEMSLLHEFFKHNSLTSFTGQSPLRSRAPTWSTSSRRSETTAMRWFPTLKEVSKTRKSQIRRLSIWNLVMLHGYLIPSKFPEADDRDVAGFRKTNY